MVKDVQKHRRALFSKIHHDAPMYRRIAEERTFSEEDEKEMLDILSEQRAGEERARVTDREEP